MKHLLPVLSLLLMTSTNAWAQNKPAPAGDIDAAAERIVSPILNRLDGAWTAGDAVKFAAEFTEDSNVINVAGTHIRGRTALEKQIQSIVSTVFKNSVHRSRTVELARHLSESIILVVSSGIIDVPAGPLAPVANSRQTFIVVNKGGVWQIQHWHNTPIQRR
jgi:uncharacterized protein (TIGR02246 family)